VQFCPFASSALGFLGVDALVAAIWLSTSVIQMNFCDNQTNIELHNETYLEMYSRRARI